MPNYDLAFRLGVVLTLLGDLYVVQTDIAFFNEHRCLMIMYAMEGGHFDVS